MKLFSWPDSGAKLDSAAFSHDDNSLMSTSVLASCSVVLGFKWSRLCFEVNCNLRQMGKVHTSFSLEHLLQLVHLGSQSFHLGSFTKSTARIA